MDYQLVLHRDEFGSNATVHGALAPGSVRAIYVVTGALQLSAGGISPTLGANSAWHSAGPLQVLVGDFATVALRWELLPAGAPSGALEGDRVVSTQVLAANMTLDPSEPYLLRCDRVDFPPGGVALWHTHRGGGIRCLLFGSIEIKTGGASHKYGPMEAWFEAGPDPVYAAASASEATAFARVMILPRALQGKSSISYVNAEDLAKPKSQRYQVFLDAPVELPNT